MPYSDTVKGCSGVNEGPRGDAMEIATLIVLRHGYALDFTHPVKRDFSINKLQPMLFDFSDESHLCGNGRLNLSIVPLLDREMGDPSEDWEHTLKIMLSYIIGWKANSYHYKALESYTRFDARFFAVVKLIHKYFGIFA